MGRPPSGALGTFDVTLRNKIEQLRRDNEGWGAQTILLELEEEFGYPKEKLPSVSSVNRFLKQQGFIPPKEPKGSFPSKPCGKPKAVHELWEMDAQGATEVKGIGYQAMINIKDGLSKKHCMAFSVVVKNRNSQPATQFYKMALRLAFTENGMPEKVQVDRDSVFFENTSRSPFPSRVHLWLTGLDVDLCFIEKRPPAQQATVERSHQTMERQAFRGKTFDCWQSFFQHCQKRRQRMNEKFPSRSHGQKAPLQAFPEAVHSGRHYSVEQEHSLLDVQRIYTLLSKGKWFRVVSSRKMICLGGHRYRIEAAVPRSQLQITFCNESNLLIFRNDEDLVIDRQPLKGVSVEELMEADTESLVLMFQKLSTSPDFPF
ncbi:MAG: hypothetical protein KatS3mg029_0429 [Saprospiraceae bacterium]|nr:MAG: hypothetical protein KatS3mg029_0429 [Saprospiraceae bacterium]